MNFKKNSKCLSSVHRKPARFTFKASTLLLVIVLFLMTPNSLNAQTESLIRARLNQALDRLEDNQDKLTKADAHITSLEEELKGNAAVKVKTEQEIINLKATIEDLKFTIISLKEVVTESKAALAKETLRADKADSQVAQEQQRTKKEKKRGKFYSILAFLAGLIARSQF